MSNGRAFDIAGSDYFRPNNLVYIIFLIGTRKIISKKITFNNNPLTYSPNASTSPRPSIMNTLFPFVTGVL